MAESLQDRLRDHAAAFDGLLSLIPAKIYYGEELDSPYQKSKKTKAEKEAAKRGRLDPESDLNQNAKEFLEERARNKRKLTDLEEKINDADENEVADNGDSDSEILDITKEKPREGLRKAATPSKKQKLEDASTPSGETPKSAKDLRREEKREKKRQKLLAKVAEKKKGAETPKGPSSAADTPSTSNPAPASMPEEQSKSESKKSKKAKKSTEDEVTSNPTDSQAEQPVAEEPQPNASASHEDDSPVVDQSAVDSSGESEVPSAVFDTEQSTRHQSSASTEEASAATSVSSTIPPSEKPKHIKIPEDTTAFRERLAARIASFRANRKADGEDGKPVRTRQELLEQRRYKQAQRKEHKKEVRRQAKLEEDKLREEALASNSPMSPALELDESTANFSFGRVAFNDGAQLSRDLSYVLNRGPKKGPSDPKTALLRLQNQKKRIAALDDEKRADIEDKEVWLTARRRAEGSKIHDDEAILKKAIKRKEKTKKKSEKEWKERAEGVTKGIKDRQKKREENLRKRREDKALGKAGKKLKKKARPGFEGSFGKKRK